MELQVGKYKNLINSISLKMAPKKSCYYSKEDFEQELWLKLYEFIKLNSGESENFPLIKSALRIHLLWLIRQNDSPLKRNITDSVESLILCGVDLVYDGFGPYEEAESKEIQSIICEWAANQDEKTQKFVLGCLEEAEIGEIKFHRVKKKFGLTTYKCCKIIGFLKKYMEKRGVTYVS